MKNNKIIEILKEDINELNGFNFKYKIIEGLSLFNKFEVCLMFYNPVGYSGFYKTYRSIIFKTESQRREFLKELYFRGILKK